MNEKQSQHLFTPFYQVKGEASSVRMMGTGLGLTIARRIVKAWGGRLFVRSIPHKGTSFSMVVPMEYAEGEADGSEQILSDPQFQEMLWGPTLEQEECVQDAASSCSGSGPDSNESCSLQIPGCLQTTMRDWESFTIAREKQGAIFVNSSSQGTEQASFNRDFGRKASVSGSLSWVCIARIPKDLTMTERLAGSEEKAEVPSCGGRSVLTASSVLD